MKITQFVMLIGRGNAHERKMQEQLLAPVEENDVVDETLSEAE